MGWGVTEKVLQRLHSFKIWVRFHFAQKWAWFLWNRSTGKLCSREKQVHVENSGSAFHCGLSGDAAYGVRNSDPRVPMDQGRNKDLKLSKKRAKSKEQTNPKSAHFHYFLTPGKSKTWIFLKSKYALLGVLNRAKRSESCNTLMVVFVSTYLVMQRGERWPALFISPTDIHRVPTLCLEPY